MKGTLGIPTIKPGGKLGNVVFIQTAQGYVVRERVTPANPRTGPQVRARAGFAEASRAWGALDDAEYAAWQAYGQACGLGGQLAYMSLTRKWLATHPGGTPPTLPPAGPFFGDNVGLRIADLGSGIAEGADPTDAGSGRSEIDDPRSAILTLVATQPNAQGVVTEVLVQPLANARRKPRARDWRTAAYVAFASGSLAVPVSVPPGAYAVAYRFVNAATGQATAMAVLGAVTVE